MTVFLPLTKNESKRNLFSRGYDMLLCKKIKIEVSQHDAEALQFMQAKCRGLYNWWVMRLRNGERWNFAQAKQSLRESKQYDPELRSVYGKLLAEVYFRLDKAMQVFFRRLTAGENPGFPRFKPCHQFFTLSYPAMYLEVQGNSIMLPTGGGGNWGPKRYPNIAAHLSEQPPDHFHEIAVSRDVRGNYYCSFIYDNAEQVEVDERKARKRRKQRASTTRGGSTTSAASRATAGITVSSTRSAPNEIHARRSPADIFISRKSTGGYLNASSVSNATVCIKPLISSHTNWLKGLW